MAQPLAAANSRTANPPWLYSWARPKAVVISQRPPAPGKTDTLTPLERSGIPLLRTWQCGAVHFQWGRITSSPEGTWIIMIGFDSGPIPGKMN